MPHRRFTEFEQVLVFDLDDTLYLERDYVESGLRAVGAWAGRQCGIEGLASVMLRLFRAGARGHIFDEALAVVQQPCSSALIARMLTVYRQHSPEISLSADAARLLSRRPPHTGLAIITDGFLDAQKRKLRALGLTRGAVDIAICTDRWGRSDWKPSTRAFDYVQSCFELAAHRFVYVADNVTKDFIAPAKLGWSTVQIQRRHSLTADRFASGTTADQVITSFDDLTIVGDFTAGIPES